MMFQHGANLVAVSSYIYNSKSPYEKNKDSSINRNGGKLNGKRIFLKKAQKSYAGVG